MSRGRGEASMFRRSPIRDGGPSTIRALLVPLPVPVEDLVKVDAVIVTHLHSDHFDDAAMEALPRSLPIFAQNE